MFNSDIKEHFRDIWSEFDPDATSFITKDQFKQFMLKLEEPLGWDQSYAGNDEK